ncbi:alkylglycerol monooxygenase-like isoform X1 [Biomphalaria glabrata]|uniref:Alkylglycerol monooxygenase n=2 Tax=Biomphalaria glabrata TaxID=6526 RepID=A0A9W3BQ47_BIOGL|nr:alkylglycerol monooxygenase-like isoform X1 [Biomphalaria glabrata]XP_055901652.1 alkylglycerol monooxygenase-like isoform X1 [Biomphalaria glabrata]XP_055901653.1 alkylglycerol monooxygenase-like isoform X1 [Biomphalaria glabrata]XP_055901654.1 alkylglycerol monooxygenase-like isoform X1 [Biomphalaria glabrata]XP_055901655.1 alkylglycerol monooxygenase-like isoform X1 [Biomphalaria glabrata]XP_055901656.1 alkylglycerol monooxygenase-like isoform X1 [Biomphalaria glabrata]XP_055901657.1 al
MDSKPFPPLQNLVTPNETSYERVENVPDFGRETLPYFIAMFLLECFTLKLQGKDWPRLNDTISNISHAVLSTLPMLLFRSTEILAYVWIYDNLRFVDRPWDNPWAWILEMLTVDFLYYWFHRISHETNIGWATHHVHHSSEDYNITTAVRHSMFDHYFKMLIYSPMALFVPPSVFYAHLQFNFLYQIWIHTTVIHHLGPLEYVLNTPSHHRVHHGRNPNYVDKNYAGVLIIWDRMFNTFQEEKEEVAYGLCLRNTFWNPIKGQLYYFALMYNKIKEYPEFVNKLFVIIKGPGWKKGYPWRFPRDRLPRVERPIIKFDSNLKFWANIYVMFHFLLLITFYCYTICDQLGTFQTSFGLMLFMFYSLYTFGALYDHKPWSYLLEFLRCLSSLLVIYLTQEHVGLRTDHVTVLNVIFAESSLGWIFLYMKNINIYL